MSDEVRCGRQPVELGLERCLVAPPSALEDGRFGLLMNRASVDRELRYACDLLAEAFPGRLAALFSPQHGLWGEQQANMIETPHGWHTRLGVPIHSLYSATRRPSKAMLADLDCFVIDLQDVGTRVYTFVWTVLHCLQACAEQGLPVVLLDRPNPLGGEAVEGPLLEPNFRSFVGEACIPMRHGLTIGELANWLNAELQVGANLTVVPLVGWRRHMLFGELNRAWILPSPNLPTLESTLVYPGQVLLEGTNLSEGRGTTIPFQVSGAPFVDPYLLADAVGAFELPGVRCLPMRFVPTFDKWRGQSCGGISLHVADKRAFQPYRTTLAILASCLRLWPAEFAWLPPPYEYETRLSPIDIISGSSRLREVLKPGTHIGPSAVAELTHLDHVAWTERTSNCRLYGAVGT